METQTFWQYILVPRPPAQWAVLALMYLVGGLIYQAWKVRNGVTAENNGTPAKFNLRYYLSDWQNWRDFAASLACAYIWLLFSPMEDFKLTMGVSVVLGALGQGIVDPVMDMIQGKNPFKK